jgi:hypothetical protein
VTNIEEIEEYWAVLRPIRLPPVNEGVGLIESMLPKGFWMSLMGDSNVELTPRIRLTDPQGSVVFQEITSPNSIIHTLAVWTSETGGTPSQMLAVLDTRPGPGDIVSINYLIDST